MSNVKPLPTSSAAITHSAPLAASVPTDGRIEPPDHLPVTAAVLSALRRRGWTIAEQRSAGWHYLILRGHGQSAVYKLVGPRFDDAGSRYQGYRIA